VGEEHDAGDGDEADADQPCGPVAMLAQRLLDDRLVTSLSGHDEHGGAVDQKPRTAEECKHCEADSVEHRVDVEVAAEAAADAGDHPVGLAPAQFFVCRVICHVASLPGRLSGVDRESPWFDPTIDPVWPRS